MEKTALREQLFIAPKRDHNVVRFETFRFPRGYLFKSRALHFTEKRHFLFFRRPTTTGGARPFAFSTRRRFARSRFRTRESSRADDDSYLAALFSKKLANKDPPPRLAEPSIVSHIILWLSLSPSLSLAR